MQQHLSNDEARGRLLTVDCGSLNGSFPMLTAMAVNAHSESTSTRFIGAHWMGLVTTAWMTTDDLEKEFRNVYLQFIYGETLASIALEQERYRKLMVRNMAGNRN